MLDAHATASDSGRSRAARREPSVEHGLVHAGVGRGGGPHIAFHNDRARKGDVVEGPWAIRRGEHIYVFYSGRAFHTTAYATGVARARSAAKAPTRSSTRRCS